jgi:hypothetical protein
MSDTVIEISFSDLLDPRRRSRLIEEHRVRNAFRDRDHAREVWDQWDGISTDGEDAHRYLNLIGDGRYCAV